jgi:AcrR family transcriptional regulator
MRKHPARTDGRSKKRPGPEKQRDAIRAAAVDLFIEKGSRSVSIAEICERADIGRQTFYRCFADKDALIAYLYQHAIKDHIDAAIRRLPTEGGSREWPYEVVDQVIDGILKQYKLAQLLYIEASNPNSVAFRITDRSLDAAATAIQAWYAETLGERPSRTHLRAVLAGTTWAVHHAIIAGLTEDAIAAAKRTSRNLLEGVYLLTRKAAGRKPRR